MVYMDMLQHKIIINQRIIDSFEALLMVLNQELIIFITPIEKIGSCSIPFNSRASIIQPQLNCFIEQKYCYSCLFLFIFLASLLVLVSLLASKEISVFVLFYVSRIFVFTSTSTLRSRINPSSFFLSSFFLTFSFTLTLMDFI